MFASVLSAAIIGVKGRLIRVEADVCAGLPAMTMVGYVSGQVREAQERVKAAIENMTGLTVSEPSFLPGGLP